LEAEIGKKRAKGYPLTNTIFEDTRRAVLYQNGAEVAAFDLTSAPQVAALLDQFYTFKEPDHDRFDQAVAEFKERVPELATGLVGKIHQAHIKNQKFQETFEGFFTLCQAAINPNISREAVDEMLVQHLLTERLFRKIFHDEEFTSRNVIAVEVEKVIAALVSKSFSRAEFLKSLDKFYKAIEGAAETIPEFQDKQHFLNTVYERFFQGYSVKAADTHGIVYTPQPIVDFMCASVEEVLKTEFGFALGSNKVNILDPCTGTGNFVVNLLRRVPGKELGRVYREQLFANEMILLPYYIASLNIEHAYFERTGSYEAFPGLCFVDTLDLAETAQPSLEFFVEKNTERVQRQKQTPITVVLGNPPYNMGQASENDNNQNRRYQAIEQRIRTTYSCDSKARLKNKLYDPYVKFLRWATDRLGSRDGIVCMITNNSFVEQIAFDGMRAHLESDFTKIYHIDLHGNVRKNTKLSGTAHNVFGIQVGVGITIAIRKRGSERGIWYHRVPEDWRREDKLSWLADCRDIRSVKWLEITPNKQHRWIEDKHASEFSGLLPLAAPGKGATAAQGSLFKLRSVGVITGRDDWAYAFLDTDLREKMSRHIRNYNTERRRYAEEHPPPKDVSGFVNNDAQFIKWTDRLKLALLNGQRLTFNDDAIRIALYRPFSRRYIYFDHLLNQRRYQTHRLFPTKSHEKENKTICCTNHSQVPFSVQITNCIPDHAVGGRLGQCFPFYIYSEDGTNRRENITKWGLDQFRTHYDSKSITKWDIFYYIYAILHHPGYRAKFANNLKCELPRIPFAPDFRAFATAGKELADLHLDYEELSPYPLEYIETHGMPLSYVVDDTMRLNKDKTRLQVNASLTLAGIPPEVFEYRLGNRSALEWVIDQYRVTEDARTGIRSDPSRAEEPEYIVSLVCQIVKVSLETVKIVNSLPKAYSSTSASQRVQA
jgi:predicted helicase